MPNLDAIAAPANTSPAPSLLEPEDSATKAAVLAERRALVATTTDGSVLRLLAGSQGLAPDPDARLPEPVPAPDLTGDMAAPGQGPSANSPLDGGAGLPPGAPPRFTGPHETTMGDPYSNLPPRRHLFHLPPLTFIPLIGPRSSEANRFIGWGEPLYGASWLNRPIGASWFAGFIEGGSPIKGVVGQHGGFFGGYRFTWDYDYYYGLEARLGMAAVSLKYPNLDYPGATSDLYVADLSMYYYPLGDARWRPFASVGIGTTKISFYDSMNTYYGGVLVSTPFSLGFKYRWREWLIYRFDATDNVAYGRGPFSTMNNVSYTMGLEVRFGGLRKSYFPWHPSNQIW